MSHTTETRVYDSNPPRCCRCLQIVTPGNEHETCPAKPGDSVPVPADFIVEALMSAGLTQEEANKAVGRK